MLNLHLPVSLNMINSNVPTFRILQAIRFHETFDKNNITLINDNMGLFNFYLYSD